MCLSGFVVLLDQLIKAYIRRQMTGIVLFEIPGVAAIVPSFNTGAAFSLFSGQTTALALISAALLTAFCLCVHRVMRLTDAGETALCCLVGGGIGNLIDRIVFGGVTDYIRLLLFDFPIFNLADIAITCSVAALVALMFMGKLEMTTGEEHGSDH